MFEPRRQAQEATHRMQQLTAGDCRSVPQARRPASIMARGWAAARAPRRFPAARLPPAVARRPRAAPLTVEPRWWRPQQRWPRAGGSGQSCGAHKRWFGRGLGGVLERERCWRTQASGNKQKLNAAPRRDGGAPDRELRGRHAVAARDAAVRSDRFNQVRPGTIPANGGACSEPLIAAGWQSAARKA